MRCFSYYMTSYTTVILLMLLVKKKFLEQLKERKSSKIWLYHLHIFFRVGFLSHLRLTQCFSILAKYSQDLAPGRTCYLMSFNFLNGCTWSGRYILGSVKMKSFFRRGSFSVVHATRKESKQRRHTLPGTQRINYNF